MSRIPIVIVGLVLASATVLAQKPATPPNESIPATQITPLMRMKLEKSKAMLEGLTLEDYDKIAANARQLKLLSTESGWNVIQTEEYAAQSLDFRRAADLVARAADEKDINRAALGYVALTVRCVECHSYMRQHRQQLLKLDPETP